MRSLALALLLAGCIADKTVPPPAPPLPIAPRSLEHDPPRSVGKGRLVLDVVGERAVAFEVIPKDDEPDGHDLRPLCRTPCALNLPMGAHRIAFVSPRELVGQESVEVAEAPLVLRAQLGYVESRPALRLAGTVSAIAAGLGVLFGIVFVAQGDGEGRDPGALRDVRAAGGVALAGSIALAGAAWLLLHLGRTESQPSSSVIFPEHTSEPGSR